MKKERCIDGVAKKENGIILYTKNISEDVIIEGKTKKMEDHPSVMSDF